MKRITLFVAALLVAVCSMAQETSVNKHSVEITFGDGSPFWLLGVDLIYRCHCGPNEFGHDGYIGPRPTRKYGVYVPSININYHNAVKEWCEVGATAGTFHSFSVYDFKGENVTNGNNLFYLMGSARFPYYRRERVQLYSGLEIGVMADHHNIDHASILNKETTWLPMLQATMLGIRVGKRFYWMGEIGIGAKGFFNTGVGCRI